MTTNGTAPRLCSQHSKSPPARSSRRPPLPRPHHRWAFRVPDLDPVPRRAGPVGRAIGRFDTSPGPRPVYRPARAIDARSPDNPQERTMSFGRGLLDDLRGSEGASHDPNPDRVFHACRQHCGPGDIAGQRTISRSCPSRASGGTGGIGAAVSAVGTGSSICRSGAETRRQYGAGSHLGDLPQARPGFPITRQEIAKRGLRSPSSVRRPGILERAALIA
jgi:hypothetical protein